MGLKETLKNITEITDLPSGPVLKAQPLGPYALCHGYVIVVIMAKTGLRRGEMATWLGGDKVHEPEGVVLFGAKKGNKCVIAIPWPLYFTADAPAGLS